MRWKGPFSPSDLPLSLSRILGSPAFWTAFGSPASPHRRGRVSGGFEGCDPADGPPAASFRAGRVAFIAPPEGARYDIVRGALRRREAPPAQCQTPHPEDRPFFI